MFLDKLYYRRHSRSVQPDGLRQKITYMHNNPVRRKLVEAAEHWEFSSARWYAGGDAAIGIDGFDW